MAWLAAHWIDVLAHLGIDATGGLTLRCAMGVCSHKRHQYIVWAVFGIIFSTTTVMVIG